MEIIKIILAAVFFMVLINISIAQDCPFGEVDDQFPGDCGLYLDTDRTGLCDYSETDQGQVTCITYTEEINKKLTGKEVRGMTVAEVADIYSIDSGAFAQELSSYLGYHIKPTESFQLLHDNYGFEPSVAKDIASAITGSAISNIEIDTQPLQKTYHFWDILILGTALYLLSYIVAKRGIIRLATHAKIWNLLLLISFLISGILGLLLVIRINYGILLPFPFNVLFWHVEAGIAMALISIFHLSWHWRYFKSYFKR